MSVLTSAPPVVRAVRQMLDLDRCYGLGLWPADGVDDRRHDLALMWQHSDLDALVTELIDPARAIVFQHEVVLPLPGAPSVAADKPIEWPLLDRRRVAGGRFIVRRHGREACYRDALRLSWNPAATLHRQAGDSAGAFHVGADHRRRLVVRRAGPRFAFADLADEAEGAPPVFLLPQEAPAAFAFQVGQQLSAVLVRTPRGLQARAIRPA